MCKGLLIAEYVHLLSSVQLLDINANQRLSIYGAVHVLCSTIHA